MTKADRLFNRYEDETERRKAAQNPRAWFREKARKRELARKQKAADLLALEKRQAAMAGPRGKAFIEAAKEAARRRLVQALEPDEEKLETMRRGFKGK